MQSDSKLLPKFGEALCGCESCGNNIIFPIHGDGERINCPHCNKPTTLKGLKLQEFVPDHLRHTWEPPQDWASPRWISRLRKMLSRKISLPRPSAKPQSGDDKTGNGMGKVVDATASGFFDFFKLLNPLFGIFCFLLALPTCGLSLLFWLLLTGTIGQANAEYDETKK